MSPFPDLRQPWAPATLLAAWLAAGCSPAVQTASTALFPLEPGYRWTYRQTTERDDGKTDTGRLVLSTLQAEDYLGQPAFRRHSDDGVDYWLRRDATGIYRVGSKHELETEIRKDRVPRYVLKEPLAVGTEWQAGTVAYLLERTQGFPREVRHEASKAVTMRYVIKAKDVTVTVPAGTFEGCLQVRGEAAVRLYVDGVNGWRDVPLVTEEWYCPGPGLVRVERVERVDGTASERVGHVVGGKLTLELQAWERP